MTFAMSFHDIGTAITMTSQILYSLAKAHRLPWGIRFTKEVIIRGDVYPGSKGKGKVFYIWPGASQCRIYYYRMCGQLSTTCSNILK